MTDRHPPRLAVWLLKRPGVSRENEALLGDLAEEFENGRSADWFWRQTFGAFRLGLNRVVPELAMKLLILFAGWGVPFSLLLALWRLRVPLGSFHETDGPLGIFWAALCIQDISGIWKNSRKSSFTEQVRDRLLGFASVSCVSLIAARWAGWFGWSWLLAGCLVCWFRHSVEVFGLAFRRFCYRQPARKSSGG